jgi:hypothetical protein
LVAEYGGATAVGVAGGSAETDCAYAVAVTPASNPKPMTVDFNKLGMRVSSFSIREAHTELMILF